MLELLVYICGLIVIAVVSYAIGHAQGRLDEALERFQDDYQKALPTLEENQAELKAVLAELREKMGLT